MPTIWTVRRRRVFARAKARSLRDSRVHQLRWGCWILEVMLRKRRGWVPLRLVRVGSSASPVVWSVYEGDGCDEQEDCGGCDGC